MRATITTSATPKEVFAILVCLTSALPSSTQDFERMGGAPSVSIGQPQFSVRVPPFFRGDVPVAWSGEVTAAPRGGSLIAARTTRAWRTGPFAALSLMTIFSLSTYFRDAPGSGVTAFLTSVVAVTAATVGWYQATHLRDSDKRKALELLEIIVKRLPDSSLVERSSAH